MHMTIYDLNQCLVRIRTYLGAKPDQKPRCCRLQHAMISFSWNTCAVSHLAFWVFAPWQWNCNITSGQYLRWHLRPILQTLCRMNARLGTCFFGLSHVNNGSLNVPIEHHPTIGYMVYNGYYKVMSNIPKMGHLPTPDLKQVEAG